MKAHHAYLLDILDEHGVAKLNATWHHLVKVKCARLFFALVHVGIFQSEGLLDMID